MHVCVYSYIYIYIYTHTCVCMYVYIYIYTHIHIHIHILCVIRNIHATQAHLQGFMGTVTFPGLIIGIIICCAY